MEERMSKHKPIPKKIRLALYEKYNHKCAYCGCDLEYNDMQVDHKAPVYVHTDLKQDMTVEEMYDESNFLPACRQCNFYKSTMSIEEFRKRLGSTMMNNLQKNFNYKLAIKYGLVVEHTKPVVFYFEYLHVDENTK